MIACGIAIAAVVTTGCETTVPKDALKLSQSTLEVRSVQTRQFEGRSEEDILSASAGVLQDLGFEIQESETKLGLIVGTKDRDAVSTQQVVGAVALALLTGVVVPIDKQQNIRAALVCTPQGPKKQAVRVTFQRKVQNTQNQVTTVEQVVDPEIYQEFFDRLSKSVFLEAHKI